ncbi:MAG: hypothetical protein LQ349_000805 [Xanthoria aureola]|nr:MAG: hypothetical protein LQ349_000805 [Xanthoria aureola]
MLDSICSKLREASNGLKEWLCNITTLASSAMHQTPFCWAHEIVTLLYRQPQWLAIVPILVLVLVQVLVLTYAMAVPTAFQVQRSPHCIAPASPDLEYSPSVKPPRHLFMDPKSSTGTSYDLLNKIERSNRNLSDSAEKWLPMLRQFQIHVQASPYSEADKRLLIEHTDDYLFIYEPLDSKDTELSVQAIQYHSNQIKNCQYVEYLLLIDLANGLLLRQIGSLQFSFSFFSKLDKLDFEQGILNRIWMRFVGQGIRRTRQRTLLIAMKKVQRDSFAYLMIKAAALDRARFLSDNLQARLTHGNWTVPYGTPFSDWLNDRRPDLKKEAEQLRNDIKLRANIREGIWE